MKTIIHTHTHRHDARVFYRYISGRNRSSCHVCARACEDRAEHVYIARTCCGRVRVAVVIRQEANVKINRLPVCALPRRTGCSPPRRRNSIIPSRDEARVCGSIYVSFHARSFSRRSFPSRPDGAWVVSLNEASNARRFDISIVSQ